MIQSLLVGGNDLLNGWWFQLNTNFDSRLLFADSLEGTEKALILSGCFLLFAVRPTRCGKREVLLWGWVAECIYSYPSIVVPHSGRYEW